MPDTPHTPHFGAALPALHPYGARREGDGVRFTLLARSPQQVHLMLFDHPDDAEPAQTIRLEPAQHRFGDIWTVHVPGAQAGQLYAYRMEGEGDPEAGGGFVDASQWLLDPYAPAVCGSPDWGVSRTGRAGVQARSGRAFPKAVVIDEAFDWGDDSSPRIAPHDMIVYEAHLRGFTAHESSGVAHPGSYAGFIEKIPHLKSLGITSVELLPIFEFDEMEYFHANDARTHLRNYWGYSTVAFFAPMSRFAATGNRGQQVTEFKQLVKALHEAGIEVILDVVYNHTAEGGDPGPVYSFRGIDNDIYYMRDEEGNFRNYSGCGNTFNANHPRVRRFIIDSLRHWVTEYHIDGFRFDLATALTRGTEGQLMARPPLIEEIDEDPILRNIKMIAEAWDAVGGYQVGSFPSPHWPEWNGRYRDDIRRFWCGEAGLLSAFATRITGSADLYQHRQQPPQKSLNFITCHDGFTLRDLVSYTRKHNEANTENNKDGENYNHSVNFGVEGPSDDPKVNARRLAQQKCLLSTLFLSQGVPMLNAGDEFSRTQRGSNNAYCQDNELSWIDWSLLEEADNQDLLAFVKKLCALRRKHPALTRRDFVKPSGPEAESFQIRWFGPEGSDPDWAKGKTLGCMLNGSPAATGADNPSNHLFVVFNADTSPHIYHLPDSDQHAWHRHLWTTPSKPSKSHLGNHYPAPPGSVTVFTSRP